MRLRSDLVGSLSDNAYLSVGHRCGAITVFGMVGTARTPVDAPDAPQWSAQLAPIIGPAAAANIQTLGSAAACAAGAARIDQRSISAGMRWDLPPPL